MEPVYKVKQILN